MTLLFYTLLALFFLLCVLLTLMILVQEAKSLGLGASFGGDVGDSLFGTATAEVLKRCTAYLAGGFLVLCFLLSVWGVGLSQSRAAHRSLPLEESRSD